MSTQAKPCEQCGGTEYVCAYCNHIVTGAAAEEIRREIREGTPNTPERVAALKRADEVYRRSGLKGLRGTIG